jgi:hypothetical protein
LTPKNSKFESLATLLRRIATAVESIDSKLQRGTVCSHKAKASRRVKPKATLDEIVRKYMRKNRQAFTEYLIDANQWTRPTVAGACMGRLQRDRLLGFCFVPGWSIALPVSELAHYCAQYGLSFLALKNQLKDMGVKKSDCGWLRMRQQVDVG